MEAHQLVVWRTPRRPPSQEEASAWLRRFAATGRAQPGPEPANHAARVAEGAAALIGAPHKPALPRSSASSFSKWANFASGPKLSNFGPVKPPPPALPPPLPLLRQGWAPRASVPAAALQQPAWKAAAAAATAAAVTSEQVHAAEAGIGEQPTQPLAKAGWQHNAADVGTAAAVGAPWQHSAGQAAGTRPGEEAHSGGQPASAAAVGQRDESILSLLSQSQFMRPAAWQPALAKPTQPAGPRPSSNPQLPAAGPRQQAPQQGASHAAGEVAPPSIGHLHGPGMAAQQVAGDLQLQRPSHPQRARQQAPNLVAAAVVPDQQLQQQGPNPPPGVHYQAAGSALAGAMGAITQQQQTPGAPLQAWQPGPAIAVGLAGGRFQPFGPQRLPEGTIQPAEQKGYAGAAWEQQHQQQSHVAPSNTTHHPLPTSLQLLRLYPAQLQPPTLNPPQQQPMQPQQRQSHQHQVSDRQPVPPVPPPAFCAASHLAQQGQQPPAVSAMQPPPVVPAMQPPQAGPPMQTPRAGPSMQQHPMQQEQPWQQAAPPWGLPLPPTTGPLQQGQQRGCPPQPLGHPGSGQQHIPWPEYSEGAFAWAVAAPPGIAPLGQQRQQHQQAPWDVAQQLPAAQLGANSGQVWAAEPSEPGAGADGSAADSGAVLPVAGQGLSGAPTSKSSRGGTAAAALPSPKLGSVQLAGQAARGSKAGPTKQAVLVNAGKFVVPAPVPSHASAWQKPFPMQALDAEPKPKKRKQAAGARGTPGSGSGSKGASNGGAQGRTASVDAAAAAPSAAVLVPGGRALGTTAGSAVAAGGGKLRVSGAAPAGQEQRLRKPAPAPAAAATRVNRGLLGSDSDDSDFELPQAQRAQQQGANRRGPALAKQQGQDDDEEVGVGQEQHQREVVGEGAEGGEHEEMTLAQRKAAVKAAAKAAKGQESSAAAGVAVAAKAPTSFAGKLAGKRAAAAAAAAAAVEGGEGASTGGKPKKPRAWAKKAAQDIQQTAPKPKSGQATVGAPVAEGAEELRFLNTGTVEVVSALGFQRFAQEMEGAPSCSVGVLLAVGATGTQFSSTLVPLTKDQLQRIKALEGGKGCKKKRQATEEDAATAVPPAQPRPVALCVLPIHLDQDTGGGRPGGTMYYVPLLPGSWGGAPAVSEEEACRGRELAEQLLSNSASIICFNMQGVLRQLTQLGCTVPAPHRHSLIDPRLLAWLHEPQLEGYGLQELLVRHAPQPAGVVPLQGVGAARDPLACMRDDLLGAMRLGEGLHGLLLPAMPAETILREMQVAAMLAGMEVAGLGFDPWLLLAHGEVVRGHMQRIERQAAEIAGRQFNLSSPSQLAEVLYTTLRLPAPTSHGRAAAKTHLPTDEAALNQLKQRSPLPGLVLEYRALQNFLSKWVDADWVRAAAGGWPSAGARLAACGDWPRVRCSWNQTATATGRLSSSSPNLQAVTKYQLETVAGQAAPINTRDAFVASQGCILLSADYSQIELRVLAHLSGDPALVGLLRQAGAAGDAFQLIASTWLGSGAGQVSGAEREKAKRVTYGIIYGLSAYGLAQGSGVPLGISVQAAQALIDSFLDHFRGVRAYLERVRGEARVHGGVRTLAGRFRPIQGLTSTDKRARAEAERKAVNTTVQGSAADIMKAAMVGWAQWREAQGCPPVHCVAQIHDELIFEVDRSSVPVELVAQAVGGIMEGVVQLQVPLIVNIKAGERWGSLRTVPPPGPIGLPAQQQQVQPQQGSFW